MCSSSVALPVVSVMAGITRSNINMEVHGAYQLHQDFTGASFPTSPSHMILWVGLNECQDWPVRLYPRSHRLGLLCEGFVPVDHPRLAKLGKPIEFQARPGTGII